MMNASTPAAEKSAIVSALIPPSDSIATGSPRRAISARSARTTYEEREMVRCKYPEEKLHRAEHHAFSEFAERTEKKMRGGDFVSSVELLTYLRDWLTNHIQTVDKKYGACLGACAPEAGSGS
jgi:hypothetical protein